MSVTQLSGDLPLTHKLGAVHEVYAECAPIGSKSAILSCAMCRDSWPLRLPRESRELEQLVSVSNQCPKCRSNHVLLMGEM